METLAKLTRFGLFDARVPRYTSYPTAPHFGPAVTGRALCDWISAIPAGSSISLYLHIPFCRRLCFFCACRTQGTSSDAPVRAYVATLKSEIALVKARLAPGVTLSRLHWGGGTPTLIPADLMRELSAAILDAAPMGKGAEFSVEIDPNEIDDARLDALAEAGMTRASIGVQDFDPEIQRLIGREQSYELTRNVIEGLRARGIRSLSTDILYGLPSQTTGRIAESVQKLLSLSPDRVALYGYAHVPWMSRRQLMIPTDLVPRAEERLQLFEVARDLLAWDGYRQVGIDHFARPDDGLAVAQAVGRLRRNFQGYTDDTAPVLIGLGASAISRFPQGYAQNAATTSDHVKAIRAGHFSTARGHVFAGEDLLRARIIEALMCDFRVSRAELSRFDVAPERLQALFDAAAQAFPGMLDLDASGLAIPPEARPLTRMIARAFDAYDQSGLPHSAAF
ncbi:oxygen-independent coproporphyrinogen III oxidase [Cereibacter changlensis]|uniref:oxygen-independent coproporphyrinogen III oxidase n=1 Tax=Cereibacter changlensis TaxID=402884 RepID=UPI004034BF9B